MAPSPAPSRRPGPRADPIVRVAPRPAPAPSGRSPGPHRVDHALPAEHLGPIAPPGNAAEFGDRLVRARLEDLRLGNDRVADRDRGGVVPLLVEEYRARPG